MRGEQVEPLGVQQDAVGLQAHIDAFARRKRGHAAHEGVHPLLAPEQRLAAVELDQRLVGRVGAKMLVHS